MIRIGRNLLFVNGVKYCVTPSSYNSCQVHATAENREANASHTAYAIIFKLECI